MPVAGFGGDFAVLFVRADNNADSVQPGADTYLFHLVPELPEVGVQITEGDEGEHQHEVDKEIPGP